MDMVWGDSTPVAKEGTGRLRCGWRGSPELQGWPGDTQPHFSSSHPQLATGNIQRRGGPLAPGKAPEY